MPKEVNVTIVEPTFRGSVKKMENPTARLSELLVTQNFYTGREGDVITFGKTLKTVPFKTGTGTITHIGHIAAHCERFGWFWFPLNIFRRVPLDEERDQLFCEENDFGQVLLTSMKDIRRAEMVTGKTIKVSRVLDLHKPGFDRKAGKPDYDNPVRLVCYLFTDK